MKKLLLIAFAAGAALYLFAAKGIESIAAKYIGYFTDKNCTAFNDVSFQNEMKSFGWYSGALWCMFFARMIFLKAYESQYPELKQLLNGSVISSYTNIKNDTSGKFKISSVPVPNSIVIWQHPATPQYGHAALCVKVMDANNFETIEGNLANSVKRTKRTTNDNSIKLLGFITIA